MIPVQRPYLGREELNAVAEIFESRWLGMGAATAEFENRLRQYLGVKHAVAVNSGTSALHIALDALNLQAGDEVIVPSLTFVASVQAILAAGARPVFCEVSPFTLNMDMHDVFRRVTSRTKAIMPVHYGGYACDMDLLFAEIRGQEIWVVEDAAHAFGSHYKGRKIGTLGDVTCFSFDPIKNITCGEGGAVVTDNDEIADQLIPKRILGINNDTWSRMRHTRNWHYEVTTSGYRYHMSNINAAIGIQQLGSLETFRARKQSVVRRYDEAFKDLDALSLTERGNIDEDFPFFYVIRVLNKRRDELMKYLENKGVKTGVHYIPNHIQPYFSDFREALPVTEQLFEEILTLPLYYDMTDDDVDLVIDGVLSFFNASRQIFLPVGEGNWSSP